jgi:hypothetical protein
VAAPGTAALSCVHHEDEVAAAIEAVGGDHPLWADSYVVGRVDSVATPEHEAVRLTLTPTHAFGGGPQQPLRLAARSDGPPDPAIWDVDGLYFVALSGFGGVGGADAIVAPCAPNFRIDDAAELERLIGAAPAVTVLEPDAVPPSGLPVPLLAGVIGASGVGLLLWVAFGRRRQECA